MKVAPPKEILSVPLHGVRVDRVTMQDTLGLIDRFVQEGGSHHVVTLDASMCVIARSDTCLRGIIQEADLVTPDSAGVLWACRRAGSPLTERVSGVEIVERLCGESPRRNTRIYFLGSAPGVALDAADRMRLKYPGCKIAGAHHGYFAPDDEPEVIERIRCAQPDVLCVAMGIPKQEKWIAEHRRALEVPVLIGVGGTLDVLSGRARRAPRWVQRLGLEWLYRVVRNPRKISKVMTLPRFALMTLRAGRAPLP